MYWNGSAWTELDRVLDDSSAWNSPTTTLWFKTQAAIAAGTRNTAYFLYYGNAGASGPPATKSNVYVMADGFENGLTNWSAGAWYSSSWLYRKPIVIDTTKLVGSQSDFPVLVSVTDPDLKAHARSDGNDFVFADADGTTKLDHEIERWNSGTGTLVAWVRKPVLSATQHSLYIYYGNASATNQQNVTGVWTNNFRSVWHLDESPTATAPQFQDSTSNANNGTNQGAIPAGGQVTGQVGGSVNLNPGATSQYISTATQYTNPANFTVEAWFKTSGASGKKIVAFETDQTGQASASYSRQIWVGTDGKLWYGVYGGATGYTVSSTGTYNDNQWHHFMAVHRTAATNMQLYVDDVDQGTVTIPTTQSHSGYWRIGSYMNDWGNGASGYFPGGVDEVRISSIPRTSTWLADEYNNQKDPSSFESLWPEENSYGVFSAATDQARSGTHALKIAATANTQNFLIANGLNETDVQLDAWWRFSSPLPDADIAMGARAGSAGGITEYESHLVTTDKWRIAEMNAGTYTKINSAPQTGSCPQVNGWFKVSVLIVGTNEKVMCGGTPIVPTSGWTALNTDLTSGSIGFRSYRLSGGNWWVDDLSLRRLVDPEPTAAFGSEDRY